MHGIAGGVLMRRKCVCSRLNLISLHNVQCNPFSIQPPQLLVISGINVGVGVGVGAAC